MTRIDRCIGLFRRRWRLMAGVSTLLLLSVAPFAVQVWHYHAITPQPARNYAAEFNAAVLRVPPEDRAWPRYRVILRDTEWPGTPNLETAIAFVKKHPDLLSQIREASEISKLGYLLSDGTLEDGWAHDRPLAASDNPAIQDVFLLPAEKLPKLAMYLHIEAIGVMLGDWERVANSICAIVSIAEQLDDLPFAVADVRSFQTYQLALDLFLRTMVFPEAYSEDQLNRIESRLMRYRDGIIRPRFGGERQAFADLTQRVFVVGEQGDGHLHLPSLMIRDPSAKTSWWEYLSAPWVSRASASFKQTMAEHSRLMDLAERESSQPAWQLRRFSLYDELQQLSKDKRFSLVTNLFPNVAGHYVAAERATESRDVAMIALALRRYVIQNGRLPENLDALVPKYIRRIPTNRFDGQVYRARLEDERLVVYSVGFDDCDDHGETRYDLPNILYDGLWASLFGDAEPVSDRDAIYERWRRKVAEGVTFLSLGDIVHHREPSPHLGLKPRRAELDP